MIFITLESSLSIQRGKTRIHNCTVSPNTKSETDLRLAVYVQPLSDTSGPSA